jgi:hypothetical protein
LAYWYAKRYIRIDTIFIALFGLLLCINICNDFLVIFNEHVGIGHNFHLKATGWKWELSTSLDGDGVPQIRNKIKISFFHGLDMRISWRAKYIFYEING